VRGVPPGLCGDQPVGPHRAGRHNYGQVEGGGQHRPGTQVQRGCQGCAQECGVGVPGSSAPPTSTTLASSRSWLAGTGWWEGSWSC
jgi:hypothetical protein